MNKIKLIASDLDGTLLTSQMNRAVEPAFEDVLELQIPCP